MGRILRKINSICGIANKMSQKGGGEGSSPPPSVRLCTHVLLYYQEVDLEISMMHFDFSAYFQRLQKCNNNQDFSREMSNSGIRS